MKFDLKPWQKTFLTLAERVITGKSDEKDRAELESVMIKNPELKDDFEELSRTFRDEMDAEFWAVAVRVIVGTASRGEVEQIRSMKTTDRKRWDKYQDALDFIDALASRQQCLKNLKTERMPQRIREKLKRFKLERPGTK